MELQRPLNLTAIFSVVLALVTLCGCERFDESLTKGLEEEKSYTRHAMEYHREHPDKRLGDSVLETWSAADYVAIAVDKQSEQGDWAKLSDQLSFLPASLKSDPSGRPFCVIQRAETIIVVRFLGQHIMDCSLEASKNLAISKIRSGDMEFSGRTVNWIYVMKRATQ